jgi:redox-sensitive bicupin YhaK (pirin superfamily)
MVSPDVFHRKEIPMFQIRRADQRGHFNHGWLDTFHTFSFADYYDPQKMGFRSLRVMNEDRVRGGTGFGMHPHHDMEIVTYVLDGQLQHRDSLGNGEVLKAGEVQTMTAGEGIRHSEFNPSRGEEVHLYQIWLLPRERGLAPKYAQRSFPKGERLNRWQTVVSGRGDSESLSIQQDASILLADLESGKKLDYSLSPGRAAWVQVLRGEIEISGERLSPGDGVAVSDESRIEIHGTTDSEVMLFDLA